MLRLLATSFAGLLAAAAPSPRTATAAPASAPSKAAAPAAPSAPATPAPPPAAALLDEAKPGPREKCPVCGMFVARYPDWVAGVRYRDGSRLLFDGVKDLMKWQLQLDRAAASRRPDAEVAAVFVTDYYALAPIDARAAFYVVGGDVLGPMGRELVPFRTKREAEGFAVDHGATGVVAFDAITPALVRALDEGR